MTLNRLQIIRSLVVNVFGKARCPVNTDEAILTLKNLLKANEFPVFLIVYNIDGVVLRDLKRQDVLSKLANLPNLHLIATVDHVNSPLCKSSFRQLYVWKIERNHLPVNSRPTYGIFYPFIMNW
jgi:hypothetical protein